MFKSTHGGSSVEMAVVLSTEILNGNRRFSRDFVEMIIHQRMIRLVRGAMNNRVLAERHSDLPIRRYLARSAFKKSTWFSETARASPDATGSYPLRRDTVFDFILELQNVARKRC